MPIKKSIQRGELSARNEIYCQERAAGATQREAYQKSRPGSTATGKSQDEIASRLEDDIKIQSRIRELKEMTAQIQQIDRADLAALLAEFALSPERSDSIRLKAADQLARIIGAYEDHQSISISGAVLTGKDRAEALRDYIASLRAEKAQE